MEEQAGTKSFFYGYLIVAASSIIQMLFLSCMFAYGVLFKELEAEFGWSRAAIAGASSLMMLMMGTLAIFLGRTNDIAGPRLLLTLTGILYGLGFMLMSQMNSLWELYLYFGVMGGFGLASHDVATLSTVNRWFIRFRGLMTGIVKSGAGLGQVLGPILASYLVMNYGWRNACLVMGLLVMAGMVLASQLMRRDPESMNTLPLSEPDSMKSNETPKRTSFRFEEARKTRSFWILCLAKFADFFCLMSVISHIVPHGIDLGLKPTVAVTILSTIGGCSIIGRLVLGSAFDRIGPQKSLGVCFSLLFMGLMLILLAKDPRLLFVFAPIYGISHGGFFAIASPTVAHFFGTRSHGMLFGTVLFFGALGGTLGPVITGRVYDLFQSYDNAFMMLIGFTVIGLLLTLALKNPNPTTA